VGVIKWTRDWEFIERIRQMSEDFDLRSLTEEEDEFLPFEEEEDDSTGFGGGDVDGAGAPFLGMSPLERMFLSIFLFMNVAILGVAILMATDRL
jgi:hypothetical protein